MSGLTVFAILAISAGLFLSLYFARDTRARRKLARAPVQAIVDVVPETTSRITGKIQRLGEEQLTAPMSGRPCAYYLVVVEEYGNGGGNTNFRRWTEVAREEQHVDFLLRDNTGVAHIRMDTPHVVAVPDHKTRSGTFDEPTAAEAAFLEHCNTQATNFLGLNRTLRYSEGALEFGEEITVLGAARPGGGEVDLVMESPAAGQLLLTDHPSTVRALPSSK